MISQLIMSPGMNLFPRRKKSSDQTVRKGSRVFAKWIDNHFYPGIIGNINGEKFVREIFLFFFFFDSKSLDTPLILMMEVNDMLNHRILFYKIISNRIKMSWHRIKMANTKMQLSNV